MTTQLRTASNAINPGVYCSDISLEVEEPLIGTATQTNLYLLIEYNAGWGSKALEESRIPDAAKTYLIKFAKNNPHSKVLLTRIPTPHSENTFLCFLASTDADSPYMRKFKIKDYQEIADLDIFNLKKEVESQNRKQSLEPLFLVCTNGRRDRCCARQGISTFKTLTSNLSDIPGIEAWECTHLGGHRFAANLLVLPHGLLYGRVNSDNVRFVIEAQKKNELYLPNLRGRTCYSPYEQVAEFYVRMQRDIASIGGLSILESRQVPPLGWSVEFLSPERGEVYRVMVNKEETGEFVYESCLLEKQTAVSRYCCNFF